MKANQLINNERRGERRELVEASLFSGKTTTVSTANSLVYFQDNAGSVGRHLTNLEQGGIIPASMNFICLEAMFRVFNLDGTSLFYDFAGTPVINPFNVMVAKGTFKLFKESDEVYSGHLAEMFSAMHLVNSGASTSLGVNGWTIGKSSGRLRFKTPITFLAGRPFRLELNVTTPAASGGYAAANTVLMWILKGKMERAK